MVRKLNIGIDIDDTVTDTFEYLMPLVAEYFNLDLNYLEENNISYTSLPDDIKDREVEFGKVYYDEAILNVPIKDNVSKYIKMIKDLGHNIIFITARSNRTNTDPVGDSKKYLDKYNILYDDVICTYDKLITSLPDEAGMYYFRCKKSRTLYKEAIKERKING